MSENFNSVGINAKASNFNLIETLAQDERFSDLSRMMGTSGANAVFSSMDQFTVLAPTNAAFAKIPEATMNALLNQGDQVDLKAILSYHILPGKLVASKLAGLRNTRTVVDGRVTISDQDRLRVNGSAVETRNIEASNGVIHAISTVLAPPVAVKPNTDTSIKILPFPTVSIGPLPVKREEILP